MVERYRIGYMSTQRSVTAMPRRAGLLLSTAPARGLRARAYHRRWEKRHLPLCGPLLSDSNIMTSAAMDEDDPWLDEDAGDASILQRNTTQEWERLSSKFSDVRQRA